jgi:uncharacterized protein (DUF1778 family)
MSAGVVPASARFEFRLRPDAKSRIERAAELLHESVSDFARSAVEQRAEEVLRQHGLITVVPTEYFDRLLAALDEPPTIDPVLHRAAQRRQKMIEQQQLQVR